MRRAIPLALLVSCALAAAPAWADDPAPDLGVAVGIVWDMGLPYALTFDPETELGEDAWNITGGMDMVWPHPYTVADIEWGNHLGYTHVFLDGERHAVVAAVGGPPVLVRMGESDAYTGENTHRSGSVIKASVNNTVLIVTQSQWTDSINYTSTTHHFHRVDGLPVEAPHPSTRGKPFFHDSEDPTKIIVSMDGQNYAAVNTVEGPPVLAGPMEAAALGLGDITVMPPDVCVWRDTPAWADCEYAPDGPAQPLPAPTVPFKATLRTEWPRTWVDVEVGGPGPYTIDWGNGNVQAVTGDPIVDPHAYGGELVLGYEPRDRPAKIRHDYGGGGTWPVSITGDVDWVRMGGDHLIAIDQWGDIRWKSMRDAFCGSPNLVNAAADMPDISRVTDMSCMFGGARSVGGISEWDVSRVTDMSRMFFGADSVGDISSWNVSSVTDMSEMFWYADSFNQNLGNWFIALDDLTVADDDPVVGRVAPQNPSFYERVSYEVVHPADGTFRIEPGDPVLAGSGVPLVAAHGPVHESLLVLGPNHNLTFGIHNVTIQATGPLAHPSTHTAQVAVQYVAPNRLPVAWAETGLLTVPSGNVVTLNGTNSYDPDGDPLTYIWNQTGGASVALHGMDSPYPTFTAPDVEHLSTLTFELVVNDGALDSREYAIMVLVKPARP